MFILNNESSDTCSHKTYYRIKITPGYCCNVHKKKVFQKEKNGGFKYRKL